VTGATGIYEHRPQYAITETEISVNGDRANQIFDFCIGEAINLAGNTPNTNNFEKNQWQTISKGESVWVTSKELEINNIVAKKAGTDTLIYRFVSERDGCMSTDTAIIQISDYPNKKIIGDSLICDNQTTSIILKDSTKPTKINWFWNGITLKDTTNTLSKLTKEGTYWATLDNGICPKTNTDTLILKVHQLTEAIAQSNKLSNIFCISDDIQLLGNTPKPKETPAWKFLENKPSITIETPNAATTKIKVIEAKTATVEYSIRLQTEDCVKKDTLTIRILDYPQAKLGGDTAICQTQIATLYSITDQKNTQLNWYKNGKLFAVQDSIKIILQSGTYTVGVKNNVCPEVLSNAIKLRIDTLPKGYILLDGKENSEIVEGTPVEISSTDPNAQNEWAIQPSEYLFAPNTTKGWWQSENKYGLNTLYLTSQNGLCTQQDTAFLYVKAKLKAPNVFTSNGDGINETFAIRGIETHPEARVSIYNRWGEQVYSTKNYADNEWNGTNCSEGVYYYIIATALQDHTGVVHLFR
jgi:gliding motility-associated-like protein